MRINKDSRWFLAAIAAVGVCVYCLILLIQPREITERMLLGRNDFIQLYAGAKLAGSPQLYSHQAVEAIQREEAGIQSESLYFIRIPAYACALRPLALLPYKKAYILFQALSLACFGWFLWKFVPHCRELAAFASISIPLFATLQNGQDTALVLFFAAASVILVRKNLDFWAGFILSFCAIKYHLMMLIPLAILIQRRWRIIYGGLAGGALLVFISFASEGLDWPRRYLAALRGQNPHPEYMPNLNSLSVLLGDAALPVVAILSLVVAAVVCYLAWKVENYELVFSFAIVGSLLVSMHSYAQDCILLLLPLALVLKKPFSKPTRNLFELAASPIPYFCLLTGTPFNLAMPCLLMGILATAVGLGNGTRGTA